jgi:hypothetical protein
MQIKWLQKRKSSIWQTPTNEIIHQNKAWLRLLYNKFVTTSDENPNIRLFSVHAAEKVISCCEELHDATKHMIRHYFKEAALTPA